MLMKRFLFLFILVLPSILFAQTLKVGVVASESYLNVVHNIKTETESFVSSKYEADVAEFLYSPSASSDSIDKVIKDAEAASDMLVFIGDVTAGRASTVKNTKPSIVLFSDQPAGDGLFDYNIVYDVNYADDMNAFQKLFGFEKIKVLTSNYAYCSSKHCESSINEILTNLKVPYEDVSVKSIDKDELAKKFKSGDCLLVMNQPQLSISQSEILLRNLAEIGVRTFSFGGYNDAKNGVMAVNSPDQDDMKVSRTVAMAVQELAAGKSKDNLVKIRRTKGLVINMEIAALAKFAPEWAFLRSAELINYDSAAMYDKFIGYRQALKNAVINNEDVATGKINLETAKSLLAMSKSALRPTLNLSSTYAVIDEDRAAYARGTAPERTMNVALELQQILYSEEVLSMKDKAGFNKLAQESLAKQAELDVTQTAAQAYLNVLRAKTYAKITQDNLERTKSNYNLAKNRDLAGAANPAELHRWEATIALAKIDVLNAENGVKLAMTELARITNEEIDGTYELEPVSIDSDYSILNVMKHGDYEMNNSVKFDKFKKLMVEQAVLNSVELKALGYLADSGERSVLSAQRKFYQPTIVVGGEYKRFLDKSGEGAVAMGEYDNTDWSVAIKANMPIYEGGKRSAELNIEKADLRKTYHQKAKVTKLVKQRMIVALENAKTAHESYMLAQESEIAAVKTMDIVADLYARGAVSITDLIDAQNARLNAEMNVASSQFGFMEKIVDVERAYGSFFAFNTKEDDERFISIIKNSGK